MTILAGGYTCSKGHKRQDKCVIVGLVFSKSRLLYKNLSNKPNLLNQKLCTCAMS